MDDKQKGFLEAYLPVQDNLWRYCLFMAKNRDNAKDLLGETIAIAYQGFQGINEPKAFLSWLFTVASRIYYRMNKKSGQFNTEETDFERLFTSDFNPEALTDVSFLYENLNKLTEEQREAIILFNIEGFSKGEIAIIQHVSENTVKSRIDRGRKKLAILMGVPYE